MRVTKKKKNPEPENPSEVPSVPPPVLTTLRVPLPTSSHTDYFCLFPNLVKGASSAWCLRLTSGAAFLSDVPVVPCGRELFVFTVIPSAAVRTRPDPRIHPSAVGMPVTSSLGKQGRRWWALSCPAAGGYMPASSTGEFWVIQVQVLSCSQFFQMVSEMTILREAPTRGGQGFQLRLLPPTLQTCIFVLLPT